MSQSENDSEKDLQQLTRKIQEGVQKTESFFSSACIYRVPEDLRKLNESAYTPRLIAIGPLHREDEHLQTPLQHVKMSYTNHLLSRLTVGMEVQGAEHQMFKVLQKCFAEMKASIDDATKCYAVEVKLDEEMMLVDGCFILELLYRFCTFNEEQRSDDPLIGNDLTLSGVTFDLLLLENQIPFLVLDKLFALTVAQISNNPYEKWMLSDYVAYYCDATRTADQGSSSNSGGTQTWCSPSDCLVRCFGNKSRNYTIEEGQPEEDLNAKYYHILHKVYDEYVSSDQTTRNKHSLKALQVRMPSASDLVYAGVKFVPLTSNKLFKVHFTKPEGPFWWCHRACFGIPPLEIHDRMESLLRNLIAFEQCHPGNSRNVSSYAYFMDMLVDSDRDVDVLEKAGVLRNYLGAPQDASDLFNQLGKGIIPGNYFVDTCFEAKQYSKRFWPKNMVILRRTYFGSPWTFIAFCVGFIAFVMSVLQFFKGYLKKG